MVHLFERREKQEEEEVEKKKQSRLGQATSIIKSNLNADSDACRNSFHFCGRKLLFYVVFVCLIRLVVVAFFSSFLPAYISLYQFN